MTFRNISLSNLRQIGLGIEEYAADHHEHFPDAAHWMDEIIPYLVPAKLMGAARQQRIAALFHDPAAPTGQTWSYAYNRSLSGLPLAKVNDPALTAAVFESIAGKRNASDDSDSGNSTPSPGWHSGGTDYLYADGHVKWLSPGATRPLFASLELSWQANPIEGSLYDSITHKPVAGTFVIFSGSPNIITPGSVWPSSFTNKVGHFQSYLHSGENYAMVLTGNRFRLLKGVRVYLASGNTEQNVIVAGGSVRASFSPPGRVILLRPARSSSLLKLPLPNAYGEVVEDMGAGHTQIIEFTPVKRVIR